MLSKIFTLHYDNNLRYYWFIISIPLSLSLFLLDIFEDLVSPVVAVQVFLSEACQKRKNILDPVMVYCVQILSEPPEKRDPRKKDGALNVIGTTAEVLMKVSITV